VPKDQDQQDIAAFYTGRRYTVTHCDGALDTFHQALGHVGAGKARSLIRQMVLQINRLADGEPMSRENFPTEGHSLPSPASRATKNFTP
jgi:hypothetical protein